MNIILLLSLWTVSITGFLNGVEMTPPPGSPPLVPPGAEQKFQTFVECMNYLDKAMVDICNTSACSTSRGKRRPKFSVSSS